RLNRYRRLLLEREQRKQAEAAEQLKDQLISNISHELRTPLSILTLLTGNLDAHYGQMEDEQRQQIVQRIRKYTQILNELVENVTIISRLDSEHPLDYQAVDLASLAEEEVSGQMPLARQKSQRLQTKGPKNLVVLGNEGQLRQVIRNLINNAIKYTPEGGKISCEAFLLEAPLDKAFEQQGGWPGSTDLSAGLWVAVRVTDNGLGIGMEDMEHLFERFYRVNMQGQTPGSGLGLSIARELIEAHDGKIYVTSQLEQGSTFAIYLPRFEVAGDTYHPKSHLVDKDGNS
ncbi:MAG: HAMP domain-containing sensor histidine kinase, partial [Chloroflexota bacterium]